MVLKTRTIDRKTFFDEIKGLNESISTLFLMPFDLIYNYVHLEETLKKSMMNIKTWIKLGLLAMYSAWIWVSYAFDSIIYLK